MANADSSNSGEVGRTAKIDISNRPVPMRPGGAERSSAVLLVDDDLFVRKVAATLLQRNGIQVVEAGDSGQAFIAIASHGLSHFDCVITDYLMPGPNGVEFAQILRRDDENLAVVLLTAVDNKEVVKESLRVGIFDFIEKPLKPEPFLEVVRSAIQQTIKHRKNRKQRYFLEGKIGEGGLGQVYRAWDDELRRHVALKRLQSPEGGVDPQEIFGEAIRLARLQHPNIVNVFDCGVDTQGPFIVMELLEGHTLETAILESDPWPEMKLRSLANQCLDALIAAHGLDMLHLDIKPANITLATMPGGGFHCKILDFGLARFMKKLQTVSPNERNCFYGSPFYVAPEFYNKEPIDVRSDLYSLGCLLYFAASKEDAFFGMSVEDVRKRHVDHIVTDLHKVCPHLGKPFCAWVMKLFERLPANRLPTALAAKEKLLSLPLLPPYQKGIA